MRVMFFCPAYTRIRGGIEAMVSSNVNHLDSCGDVETAIATIADPNSLPTPVYKTPNRTRIYQLPFTDSREERQRVARAVRDFSPDVLVARGASSTLYYLLDAAHNLPNTKVILGESASPFHATQHYASKQARVQAFTGADRIQVLMASFASSLPDFLQPRVRHIPNPVTINTTTAQPSGRPHQKKYIVNVARVTFEQKAQDVLVEAFALIARKHPGWILRIVGDVEYRARDVATLKQLIERHGLNNRVELMGSIPKSEVLKVLAESHIFAFPSTYEGFGIALGEALATGLPAVGFSEAPAVNELIEHEVNGLLAPGIRDPESYAAALDRMMSEPDARETWGANARRGAQQFSEPQIVKLWEAVLRETASLSTRVLDSLPVQADEQFYRFALAYRIREERLLYDQPKHTVRRVENSSRITKIINRLLPSGTIQRKAVVRLWGATRTAYRQIKTSARRS